MLIEGIKLFQTFSCFELQICGLKAVYWQGVGLYSTAYQLYCTVSVPGIPDIIGVFHFLAFLSNADMVPVQYEDLYRHSFDKGRTRRITLEVV